MTNDEIRRRRLSQLARETEGGLPAIARAAEVSAQNLDHIVKRRVQGKARADGNRPLVALGDKLARDIEAAMHLTPGWLDWPFENVDFDAFARLGANQRLVAQVKLSNEVQEQAAKSTALRQIDKRAVSDKKVEEHLPQLHPDKIKAAHERAHRGQSMRTEVKPGDKLNQQSLLDDNQ